MCICLTVMGVDDGVQPTRCDHVNNVGDPLQPCRVDGPVGGVPYKVIRIGNCEREYQQ